MLGIKSYTFSPNGHYFSVGYYDQSIRFYNHISWKEIVEFKHEAKIENTEEIVNHFLFNYLLECIQRRRV